MVELQRRSDIESTNSLLLADIQSVKEGGTIWIFCSEARPSVYNDMSVVEAMRRVVLDKHAHIRVITGPMVVVDEENRNGLLELQKDGTIEFLRHRSVRGWTNHFRVVESGPSFRYAAQQPHDPLEEGEHTIDLTGYSHRDLCNMAYRAIALFENWARRLSSLPEIDPLRLTEAELQELLQTAHREYSHFDYLSIKQLRKFVPPDETFQ